MLDKQVGAYNVAEEIGRGSFAVVSKGIHMVFRQIPLPSFPHHPLTMAPIVSPKETG
jgi:hypothetical protein